MIHDPIEEIWLYLSQIATSSVTTLKDNYHGGAILASHGTSEKDSGLRSTRKSGNLSDTPMVIAQRPAKSDDQVQFRVKNSVSRIQLRHLNRTRGSKYGLGTTRCEPIVWK